jgi:CDGSH-type Zn-finger protein
LFVSSAPPVLPDGGTVKARFGFPLRCEDCFLLCNRRAFNFDCCCACVSYKGSSPTPNQVAELLAFFLRLPFGMRKVLKSDQRPFEIKPQQESVWICMCGLSKNQPFCDGSHKTTRDEEDGKTYEYDAQGHRHEI